MSQPIIFVAIPSYKDVELSATVERMLLKSSNPRRLSFGICQQDDYDDWINFNRYKGIIDVRMINYLPEQSMGSSWSLKESYNLYRGEDYFLQIDAHIEFVDNWDTILLEQYKQFQQVISGPAIMACYPAAYTVNPVGDRILQELGYISKTLLYYEKDRNFPQGQALPIGDRNRPVKARYLNGGFMFGHGSFCNKVVYNPEITFWGTEIATTVRAYTHGFNLYHPNAKVCWHHYGDRILSTKKGKPHIWNEEDNKKRLVKYNDLNTKSFSIIDELLTGKYEGEYGFGKERTLEDYERYAGINFKTKERTEECSSGNYEDC
jgi:hypothetical protein